MLEGADEEELLREDECAHENPLASEHVPAEGPENASSGAAESKDSTSPAKESLEKVAPATGEGISE